MKFIQVIFQTRGAESETIEFKGEFIERKDFIETQITPSDFNGSSSNGLRTIKSI